MKCSQPALGKTIATPEQTGLVFFLEQLKTKVLSTSEALRSVSFISPTRGRCESVSKPVKTQAGSCRSGLPRPRAPQSDTLREDGHPLMLRDKGRAG